MASDAPLEETISTVLTRAGGDLLASLSATHEEAQASLEASRPALEEHIRF